MPGLYVHMDIPQEILFLEEFGGGPLLQVDRQPLVHDLRPGPGEIIGSGVRDLLNRPLRLVFLHPSPQHRGNAADGDPQEDPPFFPAEHFNQAQVQADLVDDLHQARKQLEKAQQLIQRASGLASPVQEHDGNSRQRRQSVQERRDPAFLRHVDRLADPDLPQARDQRVPGFQPAFAEDPVHPSQVQETVENVDAAIIRLHVQEDH